MLWFTKKEAINTSGSMIQSLIALRKKIYFECILDYENFRYRRERRISQKEQLIKGKDRPDTTVKEMRL